MSQKKKIDYSDQKQYKDQKNNKRRERLLSATSNNNINRNNLKDKQ